MKDELHLNWTQVVDRRDDLVEFAACHENYAWRPHSNRLHKYTSLFNAFNSAENSLRLLLQSANGNKNSRNYEDRGRALFAAVWYSDTNWGILCNRRYATLVPARELQSLSRAKTHDSEIEEILASLFEASPLELWKELDDGFYQANIAANR